jgi:hypothetical protein
MNPIILSPRGSEEVEAELKNGSPLTPERQATFERMRQMAGVRKRTPASALPAIPGRSVVLGPYPELIDSYRQTPMLSSKGSREVEEEMARPPADTPGRRALFERVAVRAAMRRRVEGLKESLRRS